jgi:hypothetical protein
MAHNYLSGQVAVSTTAVAVLTVSAGQAAVVANTGTVALFLGGASVTTTTGYSLAVGATLQLPAVESGDGETLYAISTAATTLAFLAS